MFPTQRSASSAHEFSLYFPCTAQYGTGAPVYLHLVISQSCSLKRRIFSMTVQALATFTVVFTVCSGKRTCSKFRKEKCCFLSAAQPCGACKASTIEEKYSGIKILELMNKSPSNFHSQVYQISLSFPFFYGPLEMEPCKGELN